MGPNPIIIKKGLRLGELAAEADESLLRTCFVDNGLFRRVADVADPAAIVVGRTGSGKSAVVYHAGRVLEHAVSIDLENVSIRFLEHSNIIEFLTELGVKLDIFYRQLWRHIIIVELLKLRYDLPTAQDGKSFSQKLSRALERDHAKRKGIEYVERWSERFWLEADEQLKEVTKSLDSEVKFGLGAEFSHLTPSLSAARSLAEQERVEVTSRASRVVSAIQMKQLSEITDLLVESVFNDTQKKYFIFVDKLDEDWADTSVRCSFIRALIEEVKFFRNIPQVKIVVAIRDDLLELVYDRTRSSGFQEEKYEAYTVPLQWSPDDLHKLLEKRVGEVFRRQYTGDSVGFDDVFPRAKRGGGGTSFQYLIDRTLRRPRDLLQFSNECFALAHDRERVSWRSIRAAESTYSKKRLKSLFEEWWEIYPSLEHTVEILRRMPSTFLRSTASGKRFDDVILVLAAQSTEDPCVVAAKKYCSGATVSAGDALNVILQCLYRCGAIGIKISSVETFMWSFIDQSRITRSEAKRTNHIRVHTMLHRVLEIVAPIVRDEGGRQGAESTFE